MLYKAACRKIFIDTGILLDINYILSRGKNRISDEHYTLVSDSLNYFDEMNDILYVSDKVENPTGIWHKELTYANSQGKGLIEHNNGFEFKGDYTPNDPNLYTIIIIDHASLIKKERGFATKELIDKLSEYMIILRNKCNFIPVVIQQLNRAINDPVRLKTGRMEPMLSDFKDSKQPIKDN